MREKIDTSIWPGLEVAVNNPGSKQDKPDKTNIPGNTVKPHTPNPNTTNKADTGGVQLHQQRTSLPAFRITVCPRQHKVRQTSPNRRTSMRTSCTRGNSKETFQLRHLASLMVCCVAGQALFVPCGGMRFDRGRWWGVYLCCAAARQGLVQVRARTESVSRGLGHLGFDF